MITNQPPSGPQEFPLAAMAPDTERIALVENHLHNREGWLFWEPDGPWPGYPQLGQRFTARYWLDPDGVHVWQAHDCTAGRSVSMLPWPQWQAVKSGRVEPSVHCAACGLHDFGQIDAVLA